MLKAVNKFFFQSIEKTLHLKPIDWMILRHLGLLILLTKNKIYETMAADGAENYFCSHRCGTFSKNSPPFFLSFIHSFFFFGFCSTKSHRQSAFK